MNDFERFKETYINECFELLADMEAKLIGLEENTDNVDELNAIFRCAHSIKGGAGAFAFKQIISFTHILESLLDKMRDGKIDATREVIDILLSSVDIVMQLVTAAKDNNKMPDDFGAEVKQKLAQIADMKEPAKAEKKEEKPKEVDQINLYEICFKPNPDIFKFANEPLLIMRDLKTLGEIKSKVNVENIPEFNTLDPINSYCTWTIEIETERPLPEIRAAFEFVEDNCELEINHIAGFAKEVTNNALEKDEEGHKQNNENIVQAANQSGGAAQPAAGGAKFTPISSIRVDIDKVDRLVNMVGELVITQSMIQSLAKQIPIDAFPDLLKGVEELSSHSRELQEAVMSVRMQPVKSVFSRMPRIVRDISAVLKKDIRLEMIGENTEVDKTVIEQLSDPITHMIRNSCDHGVETTEARKAKGKNPQGVIKLSASHRGGKIVMEIQDDGAGINREKVLKKAIEKGLVGANQQISDDEIDNLIFHAGFSTADQVSDISGRGVGMDVVRKNIEGLGGSIKITSWPNQGSCFTIMLPLTLAILDAMVIAVGREHYIIPIANIIETIKPTPEEIKMVTNNNSVLNVRGEFVPVIYLDEIFHIKTANKDRTGLIILVETGKEKYGLYVDELIGQQQVVIKSIEANTDPIEGISGATILGDGKVSLILDITKIYSMHFKNNAANNNELNKNLLNVS